MVFKCFFISLNYRNKITNKKIKIMRTNCYISNTIENLKKLNETIERIDEIKQLHPLKIDFNELESLKNDVITIQGGLEASLRDVTNIYKDISSFKEKNEIYLDLKKSEEAIKEYGYDYYHEGFSSTGSCYISIIDRISKKEIFIIRISDHELGENNYLPAGVINYYPVGVVNEVTLELFFLFLGKMSPIERETLWENRLVSELKRRF